MNRTKPMPRTSIAQKLILLAMVCACVALVMYKHKRDSERESNVRIDYYPYTISYSLTAHITTP